MDGFEIELPALFLACREDQIQELLGLIELVLADEAAHLRRSSDHKQTSESAPAADHNNIPIVTS